MRSLFPDDRFPGACDNTLLIAERVDFELEFGNILLPQFPVPAGHDERSYLRELVMEGPSTAMERSCPRTLRSASSTNYA